MTALPLATPPPVSRQVAKGAFPRVLLAIDFSPASLGAARWATTHVAPHADAVLMHVMPFVEAPAPGNGRRMSADDSLDRMTPALLGGLGGFGATLEAASYRGIVRAGRPSAWLASVANHAEASLLVLGRRADANRVRVGEPNVIERTARRTGASVLVVPEGTTRAPNHVVAAVDESRFAAQVVGVARRLARLHDVPLTVLHVVSPPAGAYERVIHSARHLLARAGGRRLKSPAPPPVQPALAPTTIRSLVELGGAYDVVRPDVTEVAMGDPAREIVRAATERGSPLVVVGARGADEAPPGSIGTVARELLTRGPVPVFVVHGV
jgi:nucleotide-binding universal stress UspA family protein